MPLNNQEEADSPNNTLTNSDTPLLGRIQRKLNDRDEGQELCRDCHRYSSIYTVDDNRLQLPESLQGQRFVPYGYLRPCHRLLDLQRLDEVQDELVHAERRPIDEGQHFYKPLLHIALREKVSSIFVFYHLKIIG